MKYSDIYHVTFKKFIKRSEKETLKHPYNKVEGGGLLGKLRMHKG